MTLVVTHGGQLYNLSFLLNGWNQTSSNVINPMLVPSKAARLFDFE